MLWSRRNCLRIPIDREESIKERKDKRITMVLSSEQQFHKSDGITLAVLNFWSCTPSATGSYVRPAGWLADEILAIFEIFKIHYRLK